MAVLHYHGDVKGCVATARHGQQQLDVAGRHWWIYGCTSRCSNRSQCLALLMAQWELLHELHRLTTLGPIRYSKSLTGSLLISQWDAPRASQAHYSWPNELLKGPHRLHTMVWWLASAPVFSCQPHHLVPLIQALTFILLSVHEISLSKSVLTFWLKFVHNARKQTFISVLTSKGGSLLSLKELNHTSLFYLNILRPEFNHTLQPLQLAQTWQIFMWSNEQKCSSLSYHLLNEDASK